MIDKNLLEDMSHIKLKDTDPDLLQDILEVEVKGETASQRLESYLTRSEEHTSELSHIATSRMPSSA